jgi:hypothetical protein
MVSVPSRRASLFQIVDLRRAGEEAVGSEVDVGVEGLQDREVERIARPAATAWPPPFLPGGEKGVRSTTPPRKAQSRTAERR